MLVALHDVGAAAIPLKRTLLVPCVAPKFAPAIVTAVPTAADAGARLVTIGGSVTVTLVALQLAGVAAVPLKRTVLLPCVAPKFEPAMVTTVPGAPDGGSTLVMAGGGDGGIARKTTSTQ